MPKRMLRVVNNYRVDDEEEGGVRYIYGDSDFIVNANDEVTKKARKFAHKSLDEFLNKETGYGGTFSVSFFRARTRRV